MPLPRVVLVEDDPALRRFVRMALDGMHLELLECDGVSAALQVLRAGPVDLVMTDLMMPGESGHGLLQRLQHTPELRGAAKVVVYSAGLTAAVRRQLEGAPVWRLLDKPVSVAALVACVEDALAASAPAVQPSAPVAAAGAAPDDGAAQELAIRTYFEGDRMLFSAYRAACIGQFPHDLQAGDAALAIPDLQALRRVAHSLKTVLTTLGCPELGAQARALENTSHAGDLSGAQALWTALRGSIQALVEQRT